MSNWSEFESKCVEYLNGRFGKYAKFIGEGKSNSRKPDILVITNNGKKFYIEAKYLPAQSGQFVLLPNLEKKEFEYSLENLTKMNAPSERIIKYMNDDFQGFCTAGTAGKIIDIGDDSTDIFFKWIVDNYSAKNVEFMIINDYVIFRIEDIGKYLEVSAKYRIKKADLQIQEKGIFL